MPDERDDGRSYSYKYSTGTTVSSESKRPSESEVKDLLSIRQTLLLLTGGCNIAEREEGLFCEKHGRMLGAGQSRCDYLTERFSRDTGDERNKDQIQRYVNDILGIRDPKLAKRLTG